jgi:hypothetical protein
MELFLNHFKLNLKTYIRVMILRWYEKKCVKGLTGTTEPGHYR